MARSKTPDIGRLSDSSDEGDWSSDDDFGVFPGDDIIPETSVRTASIIFANSPTGHLETDSEDGSSDDDTLPKYFGYLWRNPVDNILKEEMFLDPRFGVVDELDTLFIIIRSIIKIQCFRRQIIAIRYTENKKKVIIIYRAAVMLQKMVRCRAAMARLNNEKRWKGIELERQREVMREAIDAAGVSSRSRVSNLENQISSQQHKFESEKKEVNDRAESAIKGVLLKMEEEKARFQEEKSGAQVKADCLEVVREENENVINELREELALLRPQLEEAVKQKEEIAEMKEGQISHLKIKWQEDLDAIAKEKEELSELKESQIAHLKIKWQEDLDASKSKLSASEIALQEMNVSFEETLNTSASKFSSDVAAADRAGYFMGKLEGEALVEDYDKMFAGWEEDKRRLENELEVAAEKVVELEMVIESVKQTAMEEKLTVEAEKRNSEEGIREAKDETRMVKKRCEARVREAEFFREEAIGSLEVAQERANTRAMAMADDRVRGMKETHDLEISSLVKSWEDRLERSTQDKQRIVAKVERDASLHTMERMQEAEGRHNDEVKRLRELMDVKERQAREESELMVERLKNQHRDLMIEMERKGDEKLRVVKEEIRVSYEAQMNDLKEDCNMQVQNIRKVLVGEQRVFEEGKEILKRDTEARITEIVNKAEKERIGMEEKFSKQLFMSEQRFSTESTKMNRNFEERITAMQGLLKMKTQRIEEMEKAARSTYDYTRGRWLDPSVGKFGLGGGTAEGKFGQRHMRHPPPSVPPPPPPQPEPQSPDWYSPGIERSAAKTIERTKESSRKHVSNISALLSRVTQSPSERTMKQINPSTLTASQKLGCEIFSSVCHRWAMYKRNSYFHFWRDIATRRLIAMRVLRRVVVKMVKMKLVVSWYQWINWVREERANEFEIELGKVHKQIDFKVDEKYDDFVSRLERMRYENEKVLTLRNEETERILKDLRDEVGKVEDDLAAVRGGIREGVKQGWKEVKGDLVQTVRDSISPGKGGEGLGVEGYEEDVAAGGVKGFQERVAFYREKYGA
ncbi:hypothetical protein TL16_g04484 [Triparma laevis f. inornata]|uniref:Uncharacterized protein n=1 Tax=Triparma laevis f. inornata TaxID=1714386 RepID=A0A9W7A6I7_9STRA|nr:hypothetical protein TL16_g04484 [Triparma laevis f. inornata]